MEAAREGGGEGKYWKVFGFICLFIVDLLWLSWAKSTPRELRRVRASTKQDPEEWKMFKSSSELRLRMDFREDLGSKRTSATHPLVDSFLNVFLLAARLMLSSLDNARRGGQRNVNNILLWDAIDMSDGEEWASRSINIALEVIYLSRRSSLHYATISSWRASLSSPPQRIVWGEEYKLCQ